MNEQLAISIPVQLEMQLTLPERAQRIRDLVGTARICIIEIGRELIAAKAAATHGEWLPWLDAEFGWHENTARNYMRVAESFKSTSVVDFTGLTIDATALYALSAPNVPQEARDEAMERAEDGEHVTKADAEALIAEAMRAEQAKFAEAVARLRAEAEDNTARAISEATKNLADDNEALEAEIARIKADASVPDILALVEQLCKATGKKRLKPAQYQHLACILGTSITDGRKVYPPSSVEETQEAEERLLVSAPAMRALEYFLTAPDPDVVTEALRPFQADTARRCVSAAITWINDLNTHLQKGT